MQTKKKAAENVFESATTAAEEVMSANVGSTEPCSSLPKTTSVARAANRHRSKNRSKHPTTLDFELLDDYVPSQFLHGDVRKNGSSSNRLVLPHFALSDPSRSPRTRL